MTPEKTVKMSPLIGVAPIAKVSRCVQEDIEQQIAHTHTTPLLELVT
jgi:hypothetical protein